MSWSSPCLEIRVPQRWVGWIHGHNVAGAVRGVLRHDDMKGSTAHGRQEEDAGKRNVVRILGEDFSRDNGRRHLVFPDTPFEHPAHGVPTEDDLIASHRTRTPDPLLRIVTARPDPGLTGEALASP